MKKLLVFAAVLVLCLTAGFAVAEEIELEQVALENGLVFPVPTQWTEVELTEEERAEGYVLMLLDEDTDRSMVVTAAEMNADVTNQDLAEAFEETGDYGSIKVMDTGKLEMVFYAYADETMVGYCFVDGEGLVYNFAFMNAENEKISGDTALLRMAQECAAATGFEEQTVSLNDAEETADGYRLEEYSVGSLIFALPAGWTEVPLSEQDIEDGSLVMLENEEAGHKVLVMANEVGKGITTSLLAETLGQDPEYSLAWQVKNSHGQELVQYLTADHSVGGYALVDADGWMYIFYFSGELAITEDGQLTKLVSDCMESVYFEE